MSLRSRRASGAALVGALCTELTTHAGHAVPRLRFGSSGRPVPDLWGTGTGTDTGSVVTQRIAAPKVGSMITAPLLSMFVVPAVYLLLRRRELRRLASASA